MKEESGRLVLRSPAVLSFVSPTVYDAFFDFNAGDVDRLRRVTKTTPSAATKHANPRSWASDTERRTNMLPV